MGELPRLLDLLHRDPTNRGVEFERLCKWFLENDPRYASQLVKVWLWRDWPERWGADAGIDLVAKARDGGLWAIQAKAYGPATTVTKGDVDTFLSESSRRQFSYRLLIATTDRLSETARRTLVGQEKPVGHLLLADLLGSQVEWPSSPDDLRPHRAPVKRPRPHQEAAVHDVVTCLENAPRARLVMACGTGKTLTALFVAQAMASRRTLVLVPSLSLLAQTLTEWLANTREPMEFKAVCSDATVASGDRDAAVSTTSDLGVPVTTDPVDIAAFLRRDDGKVHRVVLATYQSSLRIAEAMAQEGVPAFDLAIADEAHRCTGPISGDFATILDANAIRAQRRVFMTATPRYFTGRIIKEAREADFEVASMDDEATFGPLAHRLTFGEAINDGLLTDYRVVIIGVDDAMYRDWVQRRQLVTSDGVKVTDARTLAGHIGLARAMRDFDLRRTITFHNRVKRARDFAHTLAEVIKWMPAELRPEGTLDARHVSGLMSAGQRRALLQLLTDPQADRTLLANARCLTEGIDVPALDGVAFIDPRRSEIDVVQAVGRAIRNAPDKKVGTIILPVFISDTVDPDTALNDSAFKTVWEVLNAMRAHDEELADWLDGMRRQLGANPSCSVVLPTKVVLELPERVSSAFVKAVSVRLVETSTSAWESWFGSLEGYVARVGHAQVPVWHVEGAVNLGRWVASQRATRDRMPQERRARLEALKGWVWEARDAQWEEGFTALVAFVEREGHARVPVTHQEAGVNLGIWVRTQRWSRANMPQKRRARLEALPEWTWNDEFASRWEEWIAALLAFVEREGHAQVPLSHVEGDLKLGSWVAIQRAHRERMSQERRARLEALPEWTWNNEFASRWEEGFAALVAFVEREGHAQVPLSHVEGDLKLGSWVAIQRAHRERMSQERRERLEALEGWAWGALDARWEEGFTALVAFVEREGHARVPFRHVEGDLKLGVWVGRQRDARERMSRARRERLEALPGWVWEALDARWEGGLAALVLYIEREGNTRVPRGHVEGGINLGTWVRTQRRARERMSQQRRECLEDLPGWAWVVDVFADRWEGRFTALVAFVEREGHAGVPLRHVEGDLKLGVWVGSQRDARERMSRARRERLEALPGWVWRAHEPTDLKSLSGD